MLPVFAALVAASTALLIFAGGLVTSTGSGLSVPDWPNTYGWFMWAFPISKMVGGIFYEHLHRLVASTVGFLIVVLAIWLAREEPRRWVRRLGYIALAAVITQGVLGGITVLWYLPDSISIAHASLAQIVFCLTTTIALVTSRGWQRGYAESRTPGADVPYFLEGGTVLGLERGDLLFPLLDASPAWVVLVLPSFGVSTKDAFGWLDRSTPAGERSPRTRRAESSRASVDRPTRRPAFPAS